MAVMCSTVAGTADTVLRVRTDMIQLPYPTQERNFIVPPQELDLPPARFPDNENNHHGYWEYKRLGRSLITRTFRDLEFNQFVLPVETHTELHRRYAPPKNLPSMVDMVGVIEAAHDLGSHVKVQENRSGQYFHQRISDIALKQVFMEYNRYNEGIK